MTLQVCWILGTLVKSSVFVYSCTRFIVNEKETFSSSLSMDSLAKQREIKRKSERQVHWKENNSVTVAPKKRQQRKKIIHNKTSCKTYFVVFCGSSTAIIRVVSPLFCTKGFTWWTRHRLAMFLKRLIDRAFKKPSVVDEWNHRMGAALFRREISKSYCWQLRKHIRCTCLFWRLVGKQKEAAWRVINFISLCASIEK